MFFPETSPRICLFALFASFAFLLVPGTFTGLGQTSSYGVYDTTPQTRQPDSASGSTTPRVPLITSNRPDQRLQPSRATQAAAFSGAGAKAEQVSAIRDAYGVSTGPITYKLGAGLDLEFNDNVFLTRDNAETDFIVRPQANLSAFWGITELNTLSFNLTAGYGYYMNNDEMSDFFFNTGFAPGSRIDLQIFTGDFVFTIYDDLSYSNSPLRIVQSATGSGTRSVTAAGDYGRLLNVIGIDGLWDLNDLVLTAGYSHFNYRSFGDTVESQDRATDQVIAAARFNFSPAIAAGIEGSMNWTSYTNNFQNDSAGHSIGPFIEWQPTANTRLRLMGGLQSSEFDEGGLNGDQEDLSSWYGAVQVGQRLTDWLSHSIEVGREADLGVNTNFTSLQYIRHRATWDVIRNWDLTTELGYEQGEDSPGEFAANTDTFTGGVSLGRMIANNLNLIFRYQYTRADSSDPEQTYEQNLLKLSLYYNY